MSIYPLPPGSQLQDTSLLIIAGISLVLEGNAWFPTASGSGRRPPLAPLLETVASSPHAQDSTEGQPWGQVSELGDQAPS